jgi:hypothetical protein
LKYAFVSLWDQVRKVPWLAAPDACQLSLPVFSARQLLLSALMHQPVFQFEADFWLKLEGVVL